ncbi:hypothetical protein SRHO_G00236380, partial [Serrasalmus rhombeus]
LRNRKTLQSGNSLYKPRRRDGLTNEVYGLALFRGKMTAVLFLRLCVDGDGRVLSLGSLLVVTVIQGFSLCGSRNESAELN